MLTLNDTCVLCLVQDIPTFKHVSLPGLSTLAACHDEAGYASRPFN